jgi:hypothetical protein
MVRKTFLGKIDDDVIRKHRIYNAGERQFDFYLMVYLNSPDGWSKKGYFIKDEDGYINLREKPNNQSKIIEKLANGTTLEILDSSKDWWYVKCLIDKKGYIHKSRIVEGN